jgi:hypothetical protein
MRRFLGVLVAGLFALSPAVLAKHETLQQLIARANATETGKQADLYMKVAEREMSLLNAALKVGDSHEFLVRLDAVTGYCDKAHSAAIRSNKKVKKTEIRIRKISRHLRDDKLSANVSDQSRVQSAIDKLEQFRNDLLQKMFGVKND